MLNFEHDAAPKTIIKKSRTRKVKNPTMQEQEEQKISEGENNDDNSESDSDSNEAHRVRDDGTHPADDPEYGSFADRIKSYEIAFELEQQ